MNRLRALAARLGRVATGLRDAANSLLEKVGASWWPWALLVAVSALVVLERIDAALAASHLPGERAGGVGDVASPARLFAPEVARQVVAGWRRRDVDQLLLGYLAVDVLLMSSVVVLLEVARRRLGNVSELQDANVDTYAAAVREALRWSGLAIVAYFVLDLAETLYVVLATGCISADGSCAPAAGGLSMGKWLALAAAIVPAGPRPRGRLADPAAPGGRGGRARCASRAPLLVVALLVAPVLVLQGGLGRQVDDVTVHAAGDLVRSPWPRRLPCWRAWRCWSVACGPARRSSKDRPCAQ